MKSIFLLFLLYGFVHGQTRLDPLVSTKQGLIRGLRADDGNYVKFLGIPYALVDEKNPFGPSVPHPEFEDVFEAYDDSTFCVQRTISGEVAGVVQCLQLHVYVPDNANSRNRVPVMVYIHGGGFSHGEAAGEYPGTLVQNDVIVVSINYRLGWHGFLCLDTPEVPGNQGLKDQVLALRWIKNNIEAFGGDPTSITAFGQAGGGMAVNAHLYSNYEKLFDRAIIQSGPALSVWFTVPSHYNAPFQLSEFFGYNTTDIDDALSFLATVDPIVLTSATYDTGLLSTISGGYHIVKPCVEKEFDGVENFMTEYILNVKNAPKVRSSSVIIGYTNEEIGPSFHIPEDDDEHNSFEDIFYFGFNRNEATEGAVDLIRNFYVGDEKEIETNEREPANIYAGDLVFNHPSQRMAEQLLDNGAKAVYRYVFSYKSNENDTGAAHGEDLAYLFDRTQFVTPFEKNEEQLLLSKRMTKLWSNFAKYGNPTPEVTDLLPVEWKPITKENQFALQIDSELILTSRPDHQRMTFWDLFYKVYETQQVGYKEDSK